MKGEPKFKKVLLKISGDFFAQKNLPLSCASCEFIAQEIKETYETGIQLGVVIGGGNIVRGTTLCPGGIDRYTADFMGMISTVINGMALRNFLSSAGIPCSLYSSIEVKGVVPLFNLEEVKKDLRQNKIVILAGGTGNPYFTTDTAAALRAVEIGAEILLKGTKVDGIYEEDPLIHPTAKKFSTLTYDEAIRLGIKVMDMSAITLCKENNIPIIVFKMDVKGNLKRIIMGEKIGSIVQEEK